MARQRVSEPGAGAELDADLNAPALLARTPSPGPSPQGPDAAGAGAAGDRGAQRTRRRTRRRRALGAVAVAAVLGTGWGAQQAARSDAESSAAAGPAAGPAAGLLSGVDRSDPVAVRQALVRAVDERAGELVLEDPVLAAARRSYARCVEAAQAEGGGARACTASYRSAQDAILERARLRAQREVGAAVASTLLHPSAPETASG
ncbi:hypothetical protein [Quadrisphaera sp. DSM 44207]|uniref:hypothetical protein n=1 Tax=Quadrisphaera sp. DSM 44207 TaxID=1881057 RepID=UPI00087E2560|nr:hypothetical protein [Quadrisphaera sp. DSM 44207]SDQ12199.1 hypothetical protein SAMN05428996_0647 [Quadrisphaera sp. DSM 44207]